MRWLFSAARQLRQLGVLGINHQGAPCILDYNPRSHFPLVDDKLRLAALCRERNIPVPRVYLEVSSHAHLRFLSGHLELQEGFVVKPNRGSGGRGVLVIVGKEGPHYVRPNGICLSEEELRQHFSDILSGMYSIAAQPDTALVQQRIHLHPAFEPVTWGGIPDVRVIVYRQEPALAMLRLPTRASAGRVNLHQGGIGAGVDLTTGRTHHVVQGTNPILTHPDTGGPLLGLVIPHWQEVLDLSRRVAEAVQLGYLGVDVVIDPVSGPMLLEANARPGLEIQIANGQGLLPRLEAIDALHEA
jgi:alpha-L-glutamate ligase-like protein